jgi:hypothetical protein
VSDHNTSTSEVVPKHLRPRCGARCRSKGGAPCIAPCFMRPGGTLAMRCRMHGGASTGAKTPEGKARLVEAGRKGAIIRWERHRAQQPHDSHPPEAA